MTSRARGPRAAKARATWRVLATDNVQDFARLHQQFVRTREERAGIPLVSPASFARSQKTMRTWVEASTSYLEEHRRDSRENLSARLSD